MSLSLNDGLSAIQFALTGLIGVQVWGVRKAYGKGVSDERMEGRIAAVEREVVRIEAHFESTDAKATDAAVAKSKIEELQRDREQLWAELRMIRSRIGGQGRHED